MRLRSKGTDRQRIDDEQDSHEEENIWKIKRTGDSYHFDSRKEGNIQAQNSMVSRKSQPDM